MIVAFLHIGVNFFGHASYRVWIGGLIVSVFRSFLSFVLKFIDSSFHPLWYTPIMHAICSRYIEIMIKIKSKSRMLHIMIDGTW